MFKRSAFFIGALCAMLMLFVGSTAAANPCEDTRLCNLEQLNHNLRVGARCLLIMAAIIYSVLAVIIVDVVYEPRRRIVHTLRQLRQRRAIWKRLVFIGG